MKKLLIVYPHLLFFQGGTKFLLEIAKRLSKNFEVTLLCNTGKESVIATFREQGVPVVTTSLFSTNSIIYWVFFPFFLLIDVIAYVPYFKKSDYILTVIYPSNLIGAICKLLIRKPYYYYCYEPYPFLQNKAFIQTQPFFMRTVMTILSYLYGWTDLIGTRKAERIITLNEITRKMTQKVYGKDAVVSLMGVDSAHFKPFKDNPIIKKYPHKKLIVHSTDYTTMKRTDLAIRALAKVVENEPDAFLLITSTQPDSPNKKQYQELAEKLGVRENCEFLGWIDYKDLPHYYAAGICYLSSSYDEMLGTTSSNLPVKEALSCGTPAIRANITTEDVEDGISGFLVDPREFSQVAEKVLYCLRNPAKASSMGLKGREKIIQMYTWEAVCSVLTKTITRA